MNKKYYAKGKENKTKMLFYAIPEIEFTAHENIHTARVTAEERCKQHNAPYIVLAVACRVSPEIGVKWETVDDAE